MQEAAWEDDEASCHLYAAAHKYEVRPLLERLEARIAHRLALGIAHDLESSVSADDALFADQGGDLHGPAGVAGVEVHVVGDQEVVSRYDDSRRVEDKALEAYRPPCLESVLERAREARCRRTKVRAA